MKLFILAGVASLSCVALAAACSSSSSKGSGGGGGDGGGEGGSSSGGSSGGDGGGSSGGSKAYFGTMTASRAMAGTTMVYTLSGGFVPTPDVVVPDASAAATCPPTGTVSGSCCFVPPAPATDAGAADAGTVNFVSAGAITFTDGTTAIAVVSPGTNGGYGVTSGANNPSVKWKAGDTLNVSAAGGVVKPFTGSVVMVEDFAGVTPALSATAAATVPLNANLAVSWTAGTANTVRVFIDAYKGTTQTGSITCDEADSAGTVSVPTALLSKFHTGDSGIILLTRTTVTPATDSNATVDLLSTTSAGGTLKFQ